MLIPCHHLVRNAIFAGREFYRAPGREETTRTRKEDVRGKNRGHVCAWFMYV